MNNVLINFKKDKSLFYEKEVSNLIKAFSKNGIELNNIVSLSCNAEEGVFTSQLKLLLQSQDNIFIIDNNNLSYSIKNSIAEKLEVNLEINEESKKNIDKYFQDNNLRPSLNVEELTYLPKDAIVLNNENSIFQGFVLEQFNSTIFYLPSLLEDSLKIIDSSLVLFYNQKYKIKTDKIYLKIFGLKQAEIEAGIKEALRGSRKTVEIVFDSEFSDFTLQVIYNDKTPKMVVDNVIQTLFENFGENIYSSENISLQTQLFNLLTVKKKVLSTAESFTAGKIASSIIENNGASNYFYEGVVCYNNNSKINRVNVSKETLKKFGAVSVEVAYEMAAGLLEKGNCDIAIATTGLAGPTGDGDDKPVGLCYIAIGFIDGIHVYKYILDGDREKITETAKRTALYNAIIKIKNI